MRVLTHRQMIVSVAAAPLARQAFPDRGCPDELLGSEEEATMREDDERCRGEGRASWVRCRRAALRFSSLMALAAFVAMLPGSSVYAVTLQVGDILVTDDEEGRVLKIDPVTGAQTIVSADGYLVAPVGIAVEAGRQLVVSDSLAVAVIRIDPATGAQTVVSSGGNLEQVTSIAVESDGNLVVTGFASAGHIGDASGWVIRVDPVSGAQTLVSGLWGRQTRSIAVEAGGTLLVGISIFVQGRPMGGQLGSRGLLVRMDPVSGGSEVVWINFSLLSPMGIAVEADGGIVVAARPDTVIRVDPVTGAQAVVSTGGNFIDIAGIAVEPDGNLVVGDREAGVIRVDPVSGAQTVVSSGVVIAGIAVVGNQPPNCDNAVADPDELWPPDARIAPVEIVGVTDPEGDPVTISIDTIAQDESLDAQGDGNTCPDADGLGTAIASLRVERSGQGDGRVYHVELTADDGQGGTCSATVSVCVPLDRGKGGDCADGGPIFDSTVCEGDLAAAASAAGLGRSCGIGFELALLLPPLIWLHRRRSG